MNIARPGAHCLASRPLTRSDPTSNLATPAHATGSRTVRSDGDTLAAVTPVLVTIVVSRPGSARSAAVAIASVPPAASVSATSSTLASKLNDANCSTTTPGPAPSTG